MRDLLLMNGYGIYVWAAYGITLFVFGLNLFFSYKEKIKIKKIVQHYLTSQHESKA
jgi:heme exporter protein CcmD